LQALGGSCETAGLRNRHEISQAPSLDSMPARYRKKPYNALAFSQFARLFAE
jgi:hypothetical protein